ncbi:MAG: tetratricopeptide repeat protein [Phycisphaerales bacterium]|nr:tetratricopeptide repeat protein [Phycisphaerales bacterium]
MREPLDVRAKRVFDEAIDLNSADRLRHLDSACADAPELRARVDTLLAAAEKQDSFLSDPTLDALPALGALSGVEQPGSQIGPYTLIKLLGEGGFGSVFLAEQSAPVRRQVALKIIKAGMDTKQVIARFEAERQTLALLDHPNIARVLEAGATTGGRPYFVMELVDGEPVTHFCDRERLSVPQRLALFRQICGAIQHAHQKGVIHRDLKPSNVLITITDGAPRAKVIDFGIAKVTAAQPTDRTFTALHQLIGTPEYMSPEQAAASADIDTRSDIYSLGVLLFELLTGTTPFDRTKLSGSGLDGMRRILREEAPLRPSLRLRSPASSSFASKMPPQPNAAGSSVIEIAARRQTAPALLVQALQRDLDWIVLKCLEKEPDRRYETASALADDIGRFLDDQPVLATPPSASYRFSKFVRRNRGAVAAGAIATAAVLVGASVSVSFAIREAHQRQVAEKAREELEQVAAFQEKQFSDIDARTMGAKLRRDLIAKTRIEAQRSQLSPEQVDSRIAQLEMLIAGSDFTGMALKSLEDNFFQPGLAAISTRFSDQPLVRARLLQAAGKTLGDLGLFEKADSPQTEALAIRRRDLGEQHPDTIKSMIDLSQLRWAQGKYQEGERLSQESLKLARRHLGELHPLTLHAIHNCGALLSYLGKHHEAELYYREALEKRRRVLGEDHPETLLTLSNLCAPLRHLKKTAEALEISRDVLDRRSRTLGNDHPDTLLSINNVAALLSAQGEKTEAEALYREVLEKHRRVLGDEHPYTLTSLNNLSNILRSQGRLSEAEPLQREALGTQRRVLGDDHPDTLQSIAQMALLLQAQKRLPEAEQHCREALAGRLRVLNADHPLTIKSMNQLGMFLKSTGRLGEAEPLCREALETLRRVQGEEHVDTLASINNLAEVLRLQGKFEEAEPLYAEALEKCRRTLGNDHDNTVVSLSNMGQLLIEQRDAVQAEPYLREAFEIRRRKLGESHMNTLTLLTNLAGALNDQGLYAEAFELMAPAESVARQTFGKNQEYYLGRFLHVLGQIQTDRCDYGAAEASLIEAANILVPHPNTPKRNRIRLFADLVHLYESWNTVEPSAGYDRRADEWREKLQSLEP